MFQSLWLVAAISWTAFLAVGFGNLPALGPLLDVHGGLWRHRPSAIEGRPLKGLRAPVRVAIDASGVPHFFADNEFDLYRVQGFVMASQRLFQMDLSSRVMASELSEIVGERGWSSDEFFLKFGMRESTLADLERFMKEPRVRGMLEAFVDGVNLYVQNLPQQPPEYRILGIEPRLFKPIHVLYMAKLLTYNLAARSHDLTLTEIQKQIGSEKVLDLFPEFHPPHLEDFVFAQTSGNPTARESGELFPFVSHLEKIPRFPLPNPGNGSNNWAVHGRRSATGYPLVANDTHLGLSLPNIWYENQLACPDFNVYGVSLNLVPGIILGFNADVAWATTNGTTDVLDFYEIDFVAPDRLDYMLGGLTMKPEISEETVKIKGLAPRKVQVVKTKMGYLVHREGPKGLVADWMGHHTNGQELKAMRGLWSARNYQDCLGALKDWRVPLQNFICADRGNISIQHTGSIPRRKIGEGRFVMNGSELHSQLHEHIFSGTDFLTVNPAEGFVESANQKVLGPRANKYLGWDYEESFRGLNIRHALSAAKKVSEKDMIDLQNSDQDFEARILLPLMISHFPKSAAFAEEQKQWFKRLEAWNFNMQAEAVEPTLFKRWLLALKAEIWSDDYNLTTPFYPKSARLAWLLERLAKNRQDPDRFWVDNKVTESVEAIDEIMFQSWTKAWEGLSKEFGKDPNLWLWKKAMRPDLRHVGRFPGFGAKVSKMNGSSTGLRGLSERHGPVYKMVVAFGKDQPQAWIQLPGHNSGDPFSQDFEKHVEDWAQGKMRSVKFYRDWLEAQNSADRNFEFLPSEVEAP